MKRLLVGIALATHAWFAIALQPYLSADKVAAGDLKAAISAVEQKLSSAGFQLLGRHTPKGLPQYGSVIVADATLVDAIKQVGGTAAVAAPIRVGVKADGSVSYVNLEYWQRALLRKDYGKAEAAVRATAAKLEKALGTGKPFGGDVPAGDLASYHYMFGMERFDDKSLLKEYPSFEDAVKAVQANLAKGAGQTAKVYELILADRKMAVFGVATNHPEHGEGWWANKIGPDHVAALPWEVFIAGGQVRSLHGRFRTALAWPSLSMGQFMGISNHPDTIFDMMEAVAGVQ